MENTTSKLTQLLRTPKILIPLVLVIFIFLGIIMFLIFRQGSNTAQNNLSESNKSDSMNSSNNSQKPRIAGKVIYGYWDGQQTKLVSTDVALGNQTLIASLPRNIKKVTVLSNDEVLFINKTNAQDHGEEISIYSTQDNSFRTVYKSTESFLIDDYVVSPNKQYIAIWEVAVNDSTKRLQGGFSRVYAKQISENSQANLVYDEFVNVPVHYPRAILNDGTIFFDTFLPNAGAGWGYGMSVTNLTGTQKETLEAMRNGTYATQPSLSPDGEYLAFIGYDGRHGFGDELVNGFRRALLMGNTVELVDTKTRTRKALPELSTSTIYSSVKWVDNHLLTFSVINPNNPQENGLYVFNPDDQQLKKVSSIADKAVLTSLSPTRLLLGKPNLASSALGNLGNSYAASIESFSVLDTQTGQETEVTSNTNFAQYVSAEPAQTFALSPNQNSGATSLQLRSFTLAPELEPKRNTQQSAPPPEQQIRPIEGIGAGTIGGTTGVPLCGTLAAEQCAAQMSAADPSMKAEIAKCNPYTGTEQHEECLEELPGNAGIQFKMCQVNKQLDLKFAGACQDSPLYLYGPDGMNVEITIHTPIYNATPAIENTFIATLHNGNKLSIDGKVYESIEYDYQTMVRADTPTAGIVIPKENLRHAVVYIATNLGLNEKETMDLVNKAQSEIVSPYIFLSFFDEATSKYMLPITFNPEPDTYINYVIYFKQLYKKPAILPPLPKFPEIKVRGPFTAVEISERFD